MMRLPTYAGFSLTLTMAVIYHAFSSRRQFYPAMVYLSTSKIGLVLLLNMGLVLMCILWQMIKRLFLGKLREVEVERLNEQSRREIMEILFAITIFRQDFSVSFLAMVTTLLLIKALHWLAQKRVEYIETTPTVPMLSHIRIVSFMGFLLLLDSLFLYSSIKFLIQTRQASVSLFFSFEYMILATTTVSIFIKYIFYVSDMLMEGQWERKAVYTFYLELIRDLLHLSMYLCFFLVIFINYGVPLHLIRELYETFRNFRLRVADYVRYRKITSNMNDRFPDATPEELNASDSTCIICREEMTTAKKLVCGHFFHVHCLRSWLERQHTCPTCRALVVPPEGGVDRAGVQHGPGPDAHQSGTGTSTAAQGSADNNLSQHQARLQAAATAASIYGKSFVYPSPNSVVWSPGYVVLPQYCRPLGDATSVESPAEQASSGQQQFKNPGASMPLPVAHFSPEFIPFQATGANAVESPAEQASSGQQQFQNFGASMPLPFAHSSPGFIPFQAPGANAAYGKRLEAQKKFIKHQIEVFQDQLQQLQRSKPEASYEEDSSELSDGKGKNVASSSFSVSDFGHDSKNEETAS